MTQQTSIPFSLDTFISSYLKKPTSESVTNEPVQNEIQTANQTSELGQCDLADQNPQDDALVDVPAEKKRKRKSKKLDEDKIKQIFKFSRRKNSRNKELEREEISNEDTNADTNTDTNTLNYFPPGWIDVGLSFKEVVDYYFKTLKNKKELDDREKIIMKNMRLLRDCYCTSKTELQLANIFIGKFGFDSFYNPYSFTLNPKFAIENAGFLDGSCPEKDGFNPTNWPETSDAFFVNPPFSKLPEAFAVANLVSQRETKPAIAIIGNFDYTNYIKDAFNYADYCILLGRVQYKPMIGVTVTSPRWSSTMTIYNSKFVLPNGSTRLFLKGKEYYAVDLKNKKSMDLLQLELFCSSKEGDQ